MEIWIINCADSIRLGSQERMRRYSRLRNIWRSVGELLMGLARSERHSSNTGPSHLESIIIVL